ncbi:OsmC family protein [bacterium]|nr:OsmC family protein [bacterium]
MANEVNIELIQVDGSTIIAKANSGHWVVMDSDTYFGGYDSATKPFELFLVSLAGCTAIDVISILKKMHIPLRKLKIELNAPRRNKYPKIPTKIDIKYIFEGENLPKENLEKAIKLSQDKYCAVSAVIKQAGIPINWIYEIKQAPPVF